MIKYILGVGSIVAWGTIEIISWIGDLITHYATLVH